MLLLELELILIFVFLILNYCELLYLTVFNSLTGSYYYPGQETKNFSQRTRENRSGNYLLILFQFVLLLFSKSSLVRKNVAVLSIILGVRFAAHDHIVY